MENMGASGGNESKVILIFFSLNFCFDETGAVFQFNGYLE